MELCLSSTKFSFQLKNAILHSFQHRIKFIFVIKNQPCQIIL